MFPEGLMFRAWHRENKVMTTEPITLAFLAKEREWKLAHPVDEYDFMLCTGLRHPKTKNLIFEGDIFREEEETDHGDIRKYLVVMWIRQRAAFYIIDAVHYQILLDNDCEDETEFAWLFDDAALYDFSIDLALPLVGNVYETPNLLNY